ncbi:SAM-dependent methyltransferase [Halobacteriales archaeon QS_1_68_20]|nr:MAG: SAM-dependent methyltransferase [Halobacteriales archaeon QS_1_68_20]
MTTSPEDHGARFDEKADEYDDDHPPEYENCLSLVLDHARARLEEGDVVLDLGAGTGAVALALATGDPRPGRAVGRDVSEGMLDRAREKATERGVENVEFGEGRFREPNYDDRVDLVVSNFAMHHLSDDEKREALREIADLGARTVVLGDVMLFGEADPSEPFYDPAVDDPATVGVLADAFTDAGFPLTAVAPVHDQVGVLVGERVPDGEMPGDR